MALYPSESEARQAAEALGPGWDLIPCDAPERGMAGLIAYRNPPDHVEDLHEPVRFEWALFGRELEADVLEVSGRELIDFIREEAFENLFLCDDPRRIILGFVSYREAAEGRCTVRQCRLTSVKALSQEDRVFLMTQRARVSRGRLTYP